MILRIAVQFLRPCLSAILIVAGSAKLVDISNVRTSLHLVGLPKGIVERYGGLIAASIASFELIVGVTSLSTLLIRFTDVVVLALMLSFVAVSLLAIARGVDAECRCFGPLRRSAWRPRDLAGRLVLLAAALAVVATPAAASMRMTWAWKSVLLVAGLILIVASATAARAIRFMDSVRSA
jgi:hypothetical protein